MTQEREAYSSTPQTFLLLSDSRTTVPRGRCQELKAREVWIANAQTTMSATVDQWSATDPPQVVKQGTRGKANRVCEGLQGTE